MKNGEGEVGKESLARRRHDETGVVDLHEPIYREKAEPQDGYEPVPMWFLFLCLALVGFGGWYLGIFSGGFRADVYDERAVLSGRTIPGGGAADTAPPDPLVLGRRVYNNCMSCHQKDGSGVAGNYPPLAGSEWIQEPAEVLAALVLHGLQGPIEVQGEAYNQVMPPWSHLTDDQIAAVLTYIRSSWGNSAPPVDAGVVGDVRQRTSDRRQAWTQQELTAFGSDVESVEVAGTT